MRIGRGQRIVTAMLVVVGGVCSIAALGLDEVHAQAAATFQDRFGSISYGGNDGSETFSGPWRERGETDGASSGIIQVAQDDRCSGGAGNCLRIGAQGEDIDGFAIDRTADVEGAEDATLRLYWRRRTQGQVDGSLRVRISGNGGTSWTTLATIPFAGSQGARTESFDVTSYAASQTVVRLQADGTGVNGYVLVDDIEIEATLAASTTTTTGATTTTTPGTTTTTTPGTTTTTIPGATTTTTTPGATTTTTTPGTTSSTIPGVTSTSVPGITSTTLATATTTTVGGAGRVGSDTAPPGAGVPSPAEPETAPPSNDDVPQPLPSDTSTEASTSTGASVDALGSAPSAEESTTPSPIVLLAAQIGLLSVVIGGLALIGVGTGRAGS